MDVPTVFFLFGGIIFIGFLGSLFFQRTKIPDVLLLMVLGMLIGPVFHIVEPVSFSGITPYFAALALIMLLFEGGLGLNLFKVLKEISRATGFAVLIFVFNMVLTGIIMSTFFSWTIYQGVLLGAVLGGSSSIIVIAVLNRIKAPENVKTLLTLESALTDVLCIIFSISLIEVILLTSISLGTVGNRLLGSFSIAAVISIIFGLVWLNVLKKFGGFEYGYLLTLAVTFLLYAFVESIKANGAIAVLVFGLMLSNATDIAKMLRLKGDYAIKRAIISFHKEMSFFIRTFFFVYIGILIDFKSVTSLKVMTMAGSVVLGIITARRLAVWFLGRLSEEVRNNSSIINAMMPRGLAAAVLASLPSSMGLEISGFVDIAFLVIIATNIITTISIYLSQKSKPV